MPDPNHVKNKVENQFKNNNQTKNYKHLNN